MRILHIIDSAGIYGAEAVLLTLAGEQQRQGHEPMLMSIGNPEAGEKALEVEWRKRGLLCIPHRMRDGLNLRGGAQMLAIAAERNADLIHSHGYKSNILLGLLSKQARGKPVVATLHGWTAKSPWSKLGLYRFLDQRLLHRMDAVVLVSERLKSARAVRTLDPNRLAVIPNGIEFAPGAPDGDPLVRRIAEFRQQTGMVIGAVGRLSAEKNFIALIEALRLARTRGARAGVVLLGDGPERAALTQAISSHGLTEHVLMAGYVPDARRYIRSFDILAISSVTEGLPITLLEAMAENLPVIATRVGDIPTVLANLGVLVPPGDVDSLADALHRMTTDPARFCEAASGGKARVRDQFSAQVMFERYDALYRRLLNGRLAPV